MNNEIKEILTKKGFVNNNPILLSIINNVIIEICNEQIKECAKELGLGRSIEQWILKTKNIAE